MFFKVHLDSEVSELESISLLSYDELEEAFEELIENFQKLMSKYNALKKKYSNLLLSYDKLELDNNKNISEIDSLKERLDHITNENRSLKERHIPPIPNSKPPVIKKKFSNLIHAYWSFH